MDQHVDAVNDMQTWVEGRMIVRSARGPWHVRLTEQAVDAMLGLHDFDFNQPWVLLVEVLDSARCSREAILRMRSDLGMDMMRSRKATAWVFGADVEGAQWMEAVLRPLYDQVGPVAFFQDSDQARQWLRAHLQ